MKEHTRLKREAIIFCVTSDKTIINIYSFISACYKNNAHHCAVTRQKRSLIYWRERASESVREREPGLSSGPRFKTALFHLIGLLDFDLSEDLRLSLRLKQI